MIPHSHSYHYGHSYYGSRASSSSASTATNDTADSTNTPPPLLSGPVVYEMDTSDSRPNNKFPAAALVLAVNNMVVYGDMHGGKHLVMVIDENPMDTGPIPEHFLNYVDEDEITDYIPTHRTTTSATAQWPSTTLAPPQQASTNETTSTLDDESTTTPMTPLPTSMPSMTTTTPAEPIKMTATDEHVLDNQWFSDVDGGI